MVKILVIKFKNFKKSRCLSVSSPELIKCFQIRFISKIFTGWALFLGGGGGDSTKFYYGEVLPEVQPLTLLYTCTIFDREGTPFVTFYSQ